MPTGIPINRQWIYILKNGSPVVEWGEGLAQDMLSGEFLHPAEGDYSHAIRDDELEMLKRAGRVESYDAQQVYIYSLPELPRRMME
jgi:hypothetical protein